MSSIDNLPPGTPSAGTRQVLSKVVLLSMPRTGSTMVTRQLASHPRISFLGAIFSVLGWSGVGREYRRLREGLSPEWDHLDYRIAHRRELMDKWFGEVEPGECYGIKHHLTGSPEVTEEFLADPGIARILLTRHNALACYSSDRMVKLKEQDAAGEAKVIFDAKDFDGYLMRRRRSYETWRPKVMRATAPWMELEYTDARVSSGMRRVVEFLGLDPSLLGSQTTPKRNADDVLTRFANPDAVVTHLRLIGEEGWCWERSPGQEQPALDAAAVSRGTPAATDVQQIPIRRTVSTIAPAANAPRAAAPTKRASPSVPAADRKDAQRARNEAAQAELARRKRAALELHGLAVPAALQAVPEARTVHRKVVLLSMPRTGSTMITRQLSSHPRIRFVDAIFGPRGWSGSVDFRLLREGLSSEWDTLEYRVAHHRELMDRWFGMALPGESLGLKHHLNGIREVTETLVDDPGITKVLLARRNILACYSSDRLVKLKESQDENEIAGKAKVPFDPRDFDRYLMRRRRAYDFWRPRLAAAAGPWMELEYTDARVRSGIESVVEFIGLDPAELGEQKTVKRNADNVLARFSNPDVVLKYLRDNGLDEWWEERSPGDSDPATSGPTLPAPAANPVGAPPTRAARPATRTSNAPAADTEGTEKNAEKRAHREAARAERRKLMGR